jgi:hypothetical protein
LTHYGIFVSEEQGTWVQKTKDFFFLFFISGYAMYLVSPFSFQERYVPLRTLKLTGGCLHSSFVYYELPIVLALYLISLCVVILQLTERTNYQVENDSMLDKLMTMGGDEEIDSVKELFLRVRMNSYSSSFMITSLNLNNSI